MKFLTLAAVLVLAPISYVSAETCLDLDSPPSSTDPKIAASSNNGNLYVKLNSANNLRDKDTFGKSDPFVEMWLDKSYKARTKDVKSNLNPVYNQTFCFYVRPGQSTLYVRAVDRDTFRNDKIGQASVSLANVFSTGREGPQNYNLPKWFGMRSDGSVNMQMQFVPDNSP
ncbi:MAG: C2 domain-containing protein [Linnemannia gamsii]|nr:MAG: C2 domain-containing protein [Linnemannia gamsii]